MVIAAGCFPLSFFRPFGNEGEIANDAGGIIQILTAAALTAIQLALADMAAGIANGIGYVKGKVITAGANSAGQQQLILGFGKMIFQVHMACAAAIQTPSIFFSVKLQLIDDGSGFIFHQEEIRIIAGAGNKIAILLIPCRIFDAKILCQSVTLMTNHTVIRNVVGGEGSSKSVWIRSTLSPCVTTGFRLSHTLSGLLHLVVQAAITLAPCCPRGSSKSIRRSLRCPLEQWRGTISVLNMISSVRCCLFKVKMGSRMAFTYFR